MLRGLAAAIGGYLCRHAFATFEEKVGQSASCVWVDGREMQIQSLVSFRWKIEIVFGY